MSTPKQIAWGTVDLSALAAELTRNDLDGHPWDEEDARQWLQRMDPTAGTSCHRAAPAAQPQAGLAAVPPTRPAAAAGSATAAPF